jgi:DNA-binding HxlR family transcriptional regulator
MLGNRYEGQDCAIARALEVVGERWTLLIVRDAFYGVRRFSDFAEHLDIPRAVLADRLRGLVEAGVLERAPDPDHAGRALYHLTRSGRQLWPVLHALARWGADFAPDGAAQRRFIHAACGTQLDEHGSCPACGVTPEAADVVAVRVPGSAPPLRSDPVSVALREPHRLLEPV